MKFKLKKELNKIGITVDIGKKYYLRDEKVEFSYLQAKEIIQKEEPEAILGPCLNKQFEFITNAFDDLPSAITWWFSYEGRSEPPLKPQKASPKPRKARPRTRKPRNTSPKKKAGIRSRMKQISEEINAERKKDE